MGSPLTVFPRDDLAAEFEKRLFSRNGSTGMTAVAARAENYWSALASAWLDREGDDSRSLGGTLLDVAHCLDNADLVGRDVKLRISLSGNPQGASPSLDANVAAKIMRCCLQLLSGGEVEAMRSALSNIVGGVSSPAIYDVAFFARLVALELHLEAGDYGQAAQCARKNLSFGCCATSQFLLFKCLSAKKRAGESGGDDGVCVDDLSGRFCSEPFNTLATSSVTRRPDEPPFFACQCPGTLPYPVSDYESGVSMDSLWNGPQIQEIRRSIHDGDFTYCSRMLCPALLEKSLPKRDEVTDPRLRDIIDNRRVVIDTPPVMLTLGHDPSCNIACPSCRNDLVTIRNGPRARLDRLADEILLPMMKDAPLSLIICTDGDPIGSKHYRRLIHNLDMRRNAQVRLMLITNGLLLTPKEWGSLSHIHPLIAFVGVSIDAAEAETYEDLRRPGKWSVITANMDHLAELRRQGPLPHLGLQFVVQKKNFKQMPAFVRMGKAWNADTIRFIKLTNIGSYTGETFEDNDVCDPRHPLYGQLITILRDPIFQDPTVSMFTLTQLWETANAAEVDAGSATNIHSTY